MPKFPEFSLLSDAPVPDYHLTAQAAHCFHTDPFLYWHYYVNKSFELPPMSAHTDFEKLFKYALLVGVDKFKDRVVTNAPINPKTDKPYGEGTDKFNAWYGPQKRQGKIPMHPDAYEKLNTMLMSVQAQIDSGYLPDMKWVLAQVQQVGPQTTAHLGGCNCYAHADGMTATELVKVITVLRIEDVDDNVYYERRLREAAYYLQFQAAVMSKQAIIGNSAYAIVVELSEPHRAFLAKVYTDKAALDKIEEEVMILNKAYEKPEMWQSKYHSTLYIS